MTMTESGLSTFGRNERLTSTAGRIDNLQLDREFCYTQRNSYRFFYKSSLTCQILPCQDENLSTIRTQPETTV
jgi:hypothetical protein